MKNQFTYPQYVIFIALNAVSILAIMMILGPRNIKTMCAFVLSSL